MTISKNDMVQITLSLVFFVVGAMLGFMVCSFMIGIALKVTFKKLEKLIDQRLEEL